MSKFTVDSAFWEIFPTARIAVLVVHDIDNTPRDDEAIASDLTAAHTTALTHVAAETWTDNAVVARWRAAFSRFKTKKGARSSIEALLKRVSNGNSIGSINPLVDVYNTVSLTHGVPVGGEDLAAVRGDIRLTIAQGGESFLPLGAEADEPALAGEVIYADDEGAICRCWNWRESARTMLTAATTDAVMVLEAVDDSTDEQFTTATEALAEAIRTRLGGRVSVHLLNAGADAVDLA